MRQFPFAERIWLQSGFLILAAIPVTIAAYHMDGRLVNDIPIWTKPLKFQVSIAVHLITLAILVRFFSEETRSAFWLSGIAVLSSLSGILETMVISLQSARGVASHFNEETVFDQIVYAVMGVGALILIMPTLVVGVRFLFARSSERLTPGLKLGAGLGLALSFLLTVPIAGYMSIGMDGHWINAPRTDAGGLPLVGWSREGGDLRVSHFFSSHLMQVLPLIGFMADKNLGRDSVWPVRLVLVATLAGVAMVIGTALQAFAGQPFIS